MIRLPDTPLPTKALGQLRRWQSDIDKLPDYPTRVERAKQTWGSRNTGEHKTFSIVRATLESMCSGARRCCYCEDSAADEVEHIHPKDLYPERAYVWENYLYACGPCNGPKNNRFAVFVAGKVTHIGRVHNAPVTPPPVGPPVLIDPRSENPLDFLMLDLQGSFMFQPFAVPGTQEYDRAIYTIKLLRLNVRDHLVRARRIAFEDFRARVKEYIQERDKGASQQELDLLITALKGRGQPTVWEEMKRQQYLIPELAALFAQAPEALNW